MKTAITRFIRAFSLAAALAPIPWMAEPAVAADPIVIGDGIIVWHDGRRIEPLHFDDAQADLSFREPAAHTAKIRRQRALQVALTRRHGVAQGAETSMTISDQPLAAATIARLAGERGDRVGSGGGKRLR